MGAALVRRGGCLLLWLALLLGCWAELGSGLEFPGAEGQWTRFPKWNACCESEMSFNMKTRSSSGLVLYFDDEGFCDFLELILTQGGRLQLSFSIFCAEPATLLSDTAVNDNLWHAVVIRRHFKNTTLIIDRAEAKWVEVKSKRRDMTVFSGLFLGGLPPELRLATLKLTLSSVKDREPFKGWITDVRVNYTQASPVESQEVRLDDEQSRLCAREDVCLNGGVCSVLNDQAVCDCSQTGFRGKDCSEGKVPFQLASTAPLPITPWRGRVGSQACMEFHLYKWISLSPLPSPPRPQLPSSPPSPPCPPHVSVADHGAITFLFSVRLGERRRLFGHLPEAECVLGLSWAEERWVLGARSHLEGRGRPVSRLARVEGGTGMLVTSSWWQLILGAQKEMLGRILPD